VKHISIQPPMRGGGMGVRSLSTKNNNRMKQYSSTIAGTIMGTFSQFSNIWGKVPLNLFKRGRHGQTLQQYRFGPGGGLPPPAATARVDPLPAAATSVICLGGSTPCSSNTNDTLKPQPPSSHPSHGIFWGMWLT
jgi:hypothetical protein